MRVPSFFLVGAPKAGTTSLFEYLRQHPDIATSSIKEPCFFAPEVPVDAATDAHRRSWESYLALFADAGDAKAVGEGSVAYLASPNAASAIRARVPDAKILMMLRDPAERLFAHYTAATASGAWRGSFADWLEHHQALETQRSPIWGPIWAGRYAQHLEHFREHFHTDHLHVSYYDDFVANPAEVLRNIFRFLDVSPDVRVNVTTRHNVTTVPRWPAVEALRAPFSAAARQLLPARVLARAQAASRAPQRATATPAERALSLRLYLEDITHLEALTGRDLSGWRE